MHPVLARYLDQDITRDVVRRAEAGEDVEPEHRHLVAAAKAHASERRAILRAGDKKLDAAGQQAVLYLATQAALDALRVDPKLSAKVAATEAALRKQGAEQEDLDSILAQAVADEAFGTDSDPGSFDEPWFLESLESIPRLMSLDEEAVEDLLSDFAQKAPAPERPLRDRSARALLESAWSEGPSLVTAEDLEDALDALSDEVSDREFAKAAALVAELIELMRDRKLVGPLRADRLGRTARSAAVVDEGAGDEEEEDDL